MKSLKHFIWSCSNKVSGTPYDSSLQVIACNIYTLELSQVSITGLGHQGNQTPNNIARAELRQY